MEIEFLKFRSSFPHQASVLQGALRQYTTDDVNDEKESLIEAERLVLNQAKQEIVGEINAALGEEGKERRESRNQFIDKLTNLFVAVGTILRELKLR